MAKPRQAKVLRIGIIQDGKIVQERLIKAGESVIVGESAKNTFVFPKTHLPSPEFSVFLYTGKGYVLQFTHKMRGKISSGGAVAGLSKIRKDPSVTQNDGVYALPLTQQDRGKISIDSVTILFQFVTPPPTQAVKPMQAMDFRARLIEDDDPVFLGFLAIWLALACVLVVWVHFSEKPEVQIQEMPDRFTRLVLAEKKDPKPKIEEEIDPNKEGEAEVRKEEKKEEAKAKKVDDKPKTKVDEAKRQEELKQEVLQKSKLLVKIIGTTGETQGGIVENLWTDEEQGLGDIDAALAEAGGIVTDASQASREGSGGKGQASDIGELGGVGGGSSELAAGPAVVATVAVGEAGTVDEDIGDEGAVRSVVKRYAGQLQYCYESRLKAVPNLQGRIEIGWSVFDGQVSGVYVVSNSTGDSELAGCIEKKIRRWRFPAGKVEGDISWPFVFKAKKG
jgi:hypothetical protein